MKISEIEVIYRPKKANRPIVDSVELASEVIRPFFSDIMEYKEAFKVVLVNRNNRILGVYTSSLGGLSGTHVDVKQILGVALKANASAVILAHNHPSGNLSPSGNDINLTKKINAACELLDLKVLDHIILTQDSYCSFMEEGLL